MSCSDVARFGNLIENRTECRESQRRTRTAQRVLLSRLQDGVVMCDGDGAGVLTSVISIPTAQIKLLERRCVQRVSH